MRYGSVCSGIEAATVAWHPLGWRLVFFAEIAAFPSAVLAYHYPEVPNLGDFTTITRDRIADDIDLLVGGTPCQSFSVAGLRGGLDDERGNLALEYLRLAQRLRPRWLVWENVPGVLSSNGGRDFGAILGGMVELGYGVAYRVLDAQFIRVDGYPRAVPQRRRRVFVVGCLGDWRRAAAVLFERESLSGHPPPRREAGKGAAPTLSARTKGGGGLGTDFDLDGGQTAVELNGLGGASHALTARHSATGRYDPNGETFVAHTLTGGGFDAGEDGSGRGTPLVAFDTTQITSGENRCNPQPGDPCHPIPAHGHAPAIAFNARQDPDVSGALPHPIDTDGQSIGVLARWRVRRLTPKECERLQGFPDGYTAIPGRSRWRDVGDDESVAELEGMGFTIHRTKKSNRLRVNDPDGPRYKALGNSMAIPPMRWIGMRIALIERLLSEQEAS